MLRPLSSTSCSALPVQLELRRQAAEALERTKRWLCGEENSQFIGIVLSPEAVGTTGGEGSRKNIQFITRDLSDFDSTAEPLSNVGTTQNGWIMGKTRLPRPSTGGQAKQGRPATLS